MLSGKVCFADLSKSFVLQHQQAFISSGNQHIILALLDRELSKATTAQNDEILPVGKVSDAVKTLTRTDADAIAPYASCAVARVSFNGSPCVPIVPLSAFALKVCRYGQRKVYVMQ